MEEEKQEEEDEEKRRKRTYMNASHNIYFKIFF